MKLKQPIAITEVARIVNAELIGDSSLQMTGINEIHKVDNGDITFVDVAKYFDKALKSAATFVLINERIEAPEGKALLLSDDPFRDYVKLVSHFNPGIDRHVSQFTKGENVTIGEDSQIHPGVVLGNNIRIGKRCVIYPNVVVYDNTLIEDDVVIHANVVIGAHAFYYKRRPSGYDKLLSCGSVHIESSVEIGASCTIDKGVSGITRIGAGSKLDNHIHVGHGVVIGKNCLIAAQVGIGGKTIIEDECIFWGQVGITKDITIGKGTVLYAQSGVGKSLKGDTVYFGSPVQEVSKAYRQLASLRQLPDLIDKSRSE